MKVEGDSDHRRDVFAQIFQLSNALQIYLDRQLLKDNLTSKQFFLMIVIGSFGGKYPTLKEVSQVAGSSHQNVKQLANKLEKKDFIEFQQDKVDGRVLRLILTDNAKKYWINRDKNDAQELQDIFNGLSKEEIKHMHSGMKKLFDNIKND